MPTQCTLLYAESNADLAREFQRRMEVHQIDAIFAASDMAGINALSRHRIDLVVANYRLSGDGGLTVLRAARKTHPGLASLLLVEPADLKHAGPALCEEGFDYLVKDDDGVYLDMLPVMAPRLINQHLQQVALDKLTQALQHEHALEAVKNNDGGMALTCTDASTRSPSGPSDWKQSNMDALTGLPGRPLFMELLKHQVQRGSRSGYNSAALLLLDIDGFQSLNRLHGNAACDMLLTEIALRLSEAVRESDVVGRMEGDQFAILAVDVHTAENVEIVAGKLLASIARPFVIHEAEIRLTASVGIAFQPAELLDATRLVTMVEEAVSHAKAAGRNLYKFA